MSQKSRVALRRTATGHASSARGSSRTRDDGRWIFSATACEGPVISQRGCGAQPHSTVRTSHRLWRGIGSGSSAGTMTGRRACIWKIIKPRGDGSQALSLLELHIAYPVARDSLLQLRHWLHWTRPRTSFVKRPVTHSGRPPQHAAVTGIGATAGQSDWCKNPCYLIVECKIKKGADVQMLVPGINLCARP